MSEQKEYFCRVDKEDKLIVEESAAVSAGLNFEIVLGDGSNDVTEVILDRDQLKQLQTQIDDVLGVETKKDMLVDFLNRHIGMSGYIWTKLQLPNQGAPEVIVNRTVSAYKKKDHYIEVYNEDLQKKDNKEVKIIAYGYAAEWEDIPEL